MSFNLSVIVCMCIIAVGAATTVYLYSHSQSKKNIKLTFDVKMILMVSFIAISVGTLILFITKYTEETRLEQYTKAEETLTALEPDYLNVLSDKIIFHYVKAKISFYQYLLSIKQPDELIQLENGERLKTLCFLNSIFVEQWPNLKTSEEKYEIRRRLKQLSKLSNEMSKYKDQFPLHDIDPNEASFILAEVIKKIRVTYNEEITNQIIQLAEHKRYSGYLPQVQSVLGHYPTIEEQKLTEQFANATIAFYRYILAYGPSKAANTMKYLSLRAHLSGE